MADQVTTDNSEIKGESKSPVRTYALLAIVLLLAAFPITQFIWGGMNYWLHMALYTLMYIAMASSWNIIGGYAGYVSLGHSVFFALGAYVSGMLFAYYDISPFLSAPLAGLAAFIVGFIVGLISLRTRGPSFIIATIALVLLTALLIDKWEAAGGASGLSLTLIDLTADTAKLPFYYGMLIMAMGAVILSYKVRHSKFGLGLRAISQDEVKSEASGIPTSLYKTLAFAFSAIFVGGVGALWAYYLTYLRPTLFLTLAISANMVLMSIIGGKGTVAGPIIGAILLIATNEFFVSNLGSSEINIVATGILMILVLLFFPAGVVGTLKERNKLPAFLDWE
jgi:branched-chain amino acid transport system permease protein